MERLGIRSVSGRLHRDRAAEAYRAFDSAEGAHLHAQGAAVAQAAVHESLAAFARDRAATRFVEADARAADGRDALLTARARLGVNAYRLRGLLQLNAWCTENDRRGTLEIDGRPGRGHGHLQAVRVREPDVLHTQPVQNLLDHDGAALLAHQRDARARMRLRARHGRSGVVQDGEGNVVAVVHGVRNAG